MAAAALVAAAASCSPPPPVAERAGITNGNPTTGDLGVVALLEGGTLVCTATLIAPRLLVTAAHCLPDGPPPVAFFGAAPAAGGTTLPIIATWRHPAFEAAQLKNDIALALLGAPAPSGATPWPLPSAPPDVGLALRLVGFGRIGAGDTTPPEKRVGTATISSVAANEIDFGPSPSQTCEGDSGGPAFATIGGVEAIVGVTSAGDASCAASARDTRVDAYAVGFIAPIAAATADGAAAVGARCWYAENCAAGAGECAMSLDDGTLSFCAPPCASNGGCPTGLSCLAGSDGRKLCRHLPPSPGALGAPCASDGDCAGRQCAARAGSSTKVCATTCFVDLPGFCPGGYQCAAVAGAPQKSACFVARKGGCAVGGDGDASALAIAMLGAVGLLAWRRRSRRAA